MREELKQSLIDPSAASYNTGSVLSKKDFLEMLEKIIVVYESKNKDMNQVRRDDVAAIRQMMSRSQSSKEITVFALALQIAGYLNRIKTGLVVCGCSLWSTNNSQLSHRLLKLIDAVLKHNQVQQLMQKNLYLSEKIKSLEDFASKTSKENHRLKGTQPVFVQESMESKVTRTDGSKETADEKMMISSKSYADMSTRVTDLSMALLGKDERIVQLEREVTLLRKLVEKQERAYSQAIQESGHEQQGKRKGGHRSSVPLSPRIR